MKSANVCHKFIMMVITSQIFLVDSYLPGRTSQVVLIIVKLNKRKIQLIGLKTNENLAPATNDDPIWIDRTDGTMNIQI